MNTEQLKLIVQKILPSPIHHWLKSQYNKVRLGSLQSLKPINSSWGFEQGKPIDRYYIENFLGRYSNDIHGHVLEIGDNYYTQQFGGDRVTKSDVLHVQDNPNATIIADLTDAGHIPSNTFDSFVLVQTLQLIYEVRLALLTTYRIMKPGGVVLATFPGITPLKDQEWNNCWCWNFTALSAQRLFEEVFPKENIQVETHGNALAATAFLQGLVVQDIPKGKLDYHDPRYEVTITVRAVKPDMR